jgi:hypothetical protein
LIGGGGSNFQNLFRLSAAAAQIQELFGGSGSKF